MRVRPEHWALLLDVCEKNPEIITNRFRGPAGKRRGNALWKELSKKLNGLGFGEKSIEHWRKTLIDWKSKTKSKVEKINKKREATDDESHNYVPLSEHETRLLSLMGSTAPKTIEHGLQEIGFGQMIKVDKSWEEELVTLIVHNDDDSNSPSTPSRKESFELIETKPDEDDYHLPKDSASVPEDSSELPPSLKVKRSSDLIEPAPEDHDYNRPTSSTRVNKPPKLRSRRGVRLHQEHKLSNGLADLSKETLQALKNIDENTQSIAESLKSIAAVIKGRLKK